MRNLQQKSHEALVKILNNIGIIGSVLAAIADMIFVIIFVIGIDIHADMTACLVFAIVNALIGVLINILLRYQGQKYAEIENEETCNKFYHKQVKTRKYMPFGLWQFLQSIKDLFVKGCTATFSVCGALYLTIEGSKNPIQILITLVTLVLFTCFGLMGMNKSYTRFYNIQLPYMEKEIEENGTL